MSTKSAVSTKVRIATVGAAVAAAAAFAPVAVSHASPAVPAPTGLGSFSSAAVDTCDPTAEECLPVAAAAATSNSQFQNQYFWLGPANPNFTPLLGITFPNFFRFNFEACVLGGALHLSPYGGGFIGIGHGC